MQYKFFSLSLLFHMLVLYLSFNHASYTSLQFISFIMDPYIFNLLHHIAFVPINHRCSFNGVGCGRVVWSNCSTGSCLPTPYFFFVQPFPPPVGDWSLTRTPVIGDCFPHRFPFAPLMMNTELLTLIT